MGRGEVEGVESRSITFVKFEGKQAIPYSLLQDFADPLALQVCDSPKQNIVFGVSQTILITNPFVVLLG